jgi:hypothetical protein
MLPEHSARIEEIEATTQWLHLLAPHNDNEKKDLLMNQYMLGQVTQKIVDDLFKILKLSEV